MNNRLALNTIVFVFALLVFTLTAMGQTEGIDTAFNPQVTKNDVSAGITALAQQADGKIMVSGDFDKINGVTRNRIARLNSDGTVDTSFNPGTGFNVAPTALAVQSNGKVLAGGGFTSYNGTTRANLISIKPDGVAEDQFEFLTMTDQPVRAIVVQPDGRILIGGGFTTVNGVSRPTLARLFADGSIDTAYSITVELSGTIHSMDLDPNGRVIAGGDFSIGNGFRTNLLGFKSTGEYDSGFNVGNFPTVKGVVRQPNGKYLVIASDSTLRRLHGNGSPDLSFQVPTVTGTINAVSYQTGGVIVIGGSFTSVNGVPRTNLARLRVNGVLERAFVTSGANGEVKIIQTNADGKTIIGGDFTNIGAQNRSGLARVNQTPAVGGITYFDFDGDARADLAVFRPGERRWYIYLSGSGGVVTRLLGESSDIPVAVDFTGDGRTDISAWRPSNGGFFPIDLWSQSSLGSFQFGMSGDDPTASGDWDGSGGDNPAVYRAGTQSRFYYMPSGGTSSFSVIDWGIVGDRPVRGDFDGDGMVDATVFRPSTGVWFTLRSSTNTLSATQFGLNDDQTVAADYDGDGKTDIAVYRPSEGNWYRLNSSNGQYVVAHFGNGGDKPVPADYDGDGRADLAVFRPSEGVWYLLRSSGGFTAAQFGISTDIPIPNVFVH